MPPSLHVRSAALALSLVALALAPGPSHAQLAITKFRSQLDGKTTTKIGTTRIRTNSSSSSSGKTSSPSAIGALVVVGLAALCLLAAVAYFLKQRYTKIKNENVASVTPPPPAFKPALAGADEETGGNVSEQGGVQRLDEHQVDTGAVRTDVSTTEHSLPSPSAWDGLGGTAPSVDLYVPESGDQTTVNVNSTSVGSVTPETLVSSYVTPPPLSSQW
jgi:hypothetical protein